MKRKDLDKVAWHLRAALEWLQSVGELFPALWQAAKVFAPLVVDFCEHCQRPRTVLWIPVGDHAQCDQEVHR